MKKRILLLFFTVAIVLLTATLAACGKTDVETTEPIATTTVRPIYTVGNPSAIGFRTEDLEGEATLPKFYVNTDSGEAITSRQNYVGASVSITGSLDDETFGLTDRRAEVRCRGNYTYTSMNKKSYRLKFEKKVNLFGQGEGEAKSWVLLANHCDKALIRNHLAFTVGKLLDNISYCSSSSYVQLYINGSYAGVYQLAEQHNVNKYRINIEEDPEVIDTDYLIERDEYADDEGEEGINYFYVGGRIYNIKSEYPDSELAAKKCEFLQDYFQDAYEAILDGRQSKVKAYIDLDSFVDTFILQAMTKNIDVGWSSFFMIKKAGGKIYFTCPWDFDLAFGNDDRLDNGKAEGLYVGSKTNHTQQHEWFYLLMNQTWFCNLVRSRWNEVSTEIYAALTYELNRFATLFKDEMAKNFDLWAIFSRKINQEPTAILRLRSYTAQVDHLKKWVEERYAYLEELINSADLYAQGGQVGNWWDDWWGW